MKNMVLTLLAITFVSAAAVGTIYEITQEPIAAAKSAKIGSAVALEMCIRDRSKACCPEPIAADADIRVAGDWPTRW